MKLVNTIILIIVILTGCSINSNILNTKDVYYRKCQSDCDFSAKLILNKNIFNLGEKFYIDFEIQNLGENDCYFLNSFGKEPEVSFHPIKLEITDENNQIIGDYFQWSREGSQIPISASYWMKCSPGESLLNSNIGLYACDPPGTLFYLPISETVKINGSSNYYLQLIFSEAFIFPKPGICDEADLGNSEYWNSLNEANKKELFRSNRVKIKIIKLNGK